MAHKSQTHTCSCTLQVKQQVESQIKVRDVSAGHFNTAFFACPSYPSPPQLPADVCSSRTPPSTIAPADYSSSWHDVRTELMAEAKTGFKARVESELAAAGEHQSNHESFNTP